MEYFIIWVKFQNITQSTLLNKECLNPEIYSLTSAIMCVFGVACLTTVVSIFSAVWIPDVDNTVYCKVSSLLKHTIILRRFILIRTSERKILPVWMIWSWQKHCNCSGKNGWRSDKVNVTITKILVLRKIILCTLYMGRRILNSFNFMQVTSITASFIPLTFKIWRYIFIYLFKNRNGIIRR